MRPQPNKPIVSRGKVLGGPLPLVCVPLVGKSREEILKEAGNIPSIGPDIIELRVDAWEFVEDTAASLSMIKDVRAPQGRYRLFSPAGGIGREASKRCPTGRSLPFTGRPPE